MINAAYNDCEDFWAKMIIFGWKVVFQLFLNFEWQVITGSSTPPNGREDTVSGHQLLLTTPPLEIHFSFFWHSPSLAQVVLTHSLMIHVLPGILLTYFKLISCPDIHLRHTQNKPFKHLQALQTL